MTSRGSVFHPHPLWRNAFRSVVSALLLLLALSACGGEARLALPDQPGSTPAPRLQLQELAPVAASPVSTAPAIGDAIWTTAIAPATQGPVDDVTSYLVDAPSIIAVLPAANLPPNAEVAASWSYNATSLDAFATRLVVSAGPENRWITLRLDRAPDRFWPPGVYEVAVSIDGVLVQEASVEVINPQ